MAISNIAEMVADKFSKLVWCITDRPLPARQAAAYINFCIHTEMLYDKKIYEGLLRFSKDFYAFTGHRIAVAISTPRCPIVKEALIKNNITPEAFSSRVLDISKFADIGYHGHFYRESANGLIPVSKDNYDKGLVINQIRDEIDWLRTIGISPKIYAGGWWFLSEDIVLELENSGITADVSVRKGKDDTFGGRYLDDAPAPGKPFMLPPSKNILEIQSVFGPIMAAPVMKKHLSGYLQNERGSALFFIFPLHDWDIPKYYTNIWKNVVEISSSKNSIAWMDILKMREMFMRSGCEAK